MLRFRESTNSNLIDVQWMMQFEIAFEITFDIFENKVDMLSVATGLFAEHFFQPIPKELNEDVYGSSTRVT